MWKGEEGSEMGQREKVNCPRQDGGLSQPHTKSPGARIALANGPTLDPEGQALGLLQ